jgi:hypothetical protein
MLKLIGLKFKEISTMTKQNHNTILTAYQKSLVSIMEQLEGKGLLSLKRIRNERRGGYKSPKDYKVSMTF